MPLQKQSILSYAPRLHSYFLAALPDKFSSVPAFCSTVRTILNICTVHSFLLFGISLYTLPHAVPTVRPTVCQYSFNCCLVFLITSFHVPCSTYIFFYSLPVRYLNLFRIAFSVISQPRCCGAVPTFYHYNFCWYISAQVLWCSTYILLL